MAARGGIVAILDSTSQIIGHRWLIPLIAVFLITHSPAVILAAPEPQQKETVHASKCMYYSDNESYENARQQALVKIAREAVQRHRIYVQSATRVKNLQLEEDIIATTSSAMLKEFTIEKEERKIQEICLTISAQLDLQTTEETIRQRLTAKEVAKEAQDAVTTQKQDFALTVWTNKPSNTFLEHDRLIIYVKSERDAYLRLDYFQADGTVLHLVPNVYRGQAKIEAGKTYAFGDANSPEEFIIQGPFGDEVINAMASLTPIVLSKEPTGPTSDSRTYIQSSLRGVKLQQKVTTAVSLPMKTESTDAQAFKGQSAKTGPMPPAKP